ncbi:MAG TPA: tetratricopeptide repeat protein [Candidatus Aminicenantes bacterium]|nr:tetratricopeptide repeat protein [Candidatus Aminicenantes bacterium]
MKRSLTAILLALLLGAAVSATVSPEDVSMERAKILLFDKQWRRALAEIDRVLETHPDFAPALYYRARCLAELGRKKEALTGYKRFLEMNGSETLREEARISMIDLAFSLHSGGMKGYLQTILDFLDSPRQTVRFYAALKLSYLDEKKTAAKAVPVLKRVAKKRSDPDLADRAKIALLRIDPRHLEDSPSDVNGMDNAMLRIEVVNHRTGKPSLTIRIPFMLARLALEALPEAERKALQSRGYSLDRIIQTLSSSREIIRLETEDEEVRIWVDHK